MESTEVLLRNATTVLLDLTNRSRYFFYLVSPYEALFPDLESTPRFITKVSFLNKF